MFYLNVDELDDLQNQVMNIVENLDITRAQLVQFSVSTSQIKNRIVEVHVKRETNGDLTYKYSWK